MEDPTRQRDDSIGQIVDQVCDAFEVAWKACKEKDAPTPQIEDFLEHLPLTTKDGPTTRQPELLEKLLGELVAVDVVYRTQSGKSASLESYLERFPQAAREIRRQFELAAMTEINEQTEPFKRVRPVIKSIQASADYDEIRFHAEGGLGEVYRGIDRQLHREVAVKCVHLEHLNNREIRERFLIEAEVTSRLDHPGIVPVYTMGTDSLGRPFYVMRFIEGWTLRAVIDEFHETDWRQKGRSARRLELHRLLRHLIDACNAIAYAHNRGVIHRDIKPENIMLGKFGETLLVDWGLAQFVERDARARASGEKTLFADHSDTVDPSESSGAGAGTIGYISPEQLPGGIEPIGSRSDIYSLGATLYKLLTGATPFHRDPDRRIWDEIRAGNFRRPREVTPSCPAALEAICLKAMAARPSLRYESAEQFASDLDRWMADEPVVVYREPLVERFLRRARRHRAGTIALGVGTLLMLIVAIGSSVLFGQMAESETVLRISAQKAQKEAEDSRSAAERARLSHLQSTAVFAARAIGYEIDQRWRILQRLAENPQLRKLLAATDKPTIADKPLVDSPTTTENPTATEKSPVDSPEWEAIQRWLRHEAAGSVDSRQAVSWFIVSRKGLQVARYPWKKTIGRPFYHRSYFHRGPHDLPKATPLEEIEPIDRPKVSAVYLSSDTTNNFKVAFSVPIYDSDAKSTRQFLGVLCMSVELGRFTQLPERRERMTVALADLRPDQLDGSTHTGLLLDHPSFKAGSTSSSLARLPESIVAQLEAQREAWRSSGSTGMVRPILIEQFADPAFSKGSKSRSAALQCVLVPAPVPLDQTSEGNKDVGWVVIIQDWEE